MDTCRAGSGAAEQVPGVADDVAEDATRPHASVRGGAMLTARGGALLLSWVVMLPLAVRRVKT